MQTVLEEDFSTFSGLEARVSAVIKEYEVFGGGFERLRVELCKVSSNVLEVQKGVEVMKRIFQHKLRCFKSCESDQVNNILPFVRSSSKILVHGSGHMLALVIACAVEHQEGVQFFICEGLPKTSMCEHGSGAELLQKAKQTRDDEDLKDKIVRSCTIIPDSSVGAILGMVDFVLMGSYCVTEHGGLVHSTGSFQLATLASSMNVPCYVMCETFKFSRVFPLSTEDLVQPQRECQVVPLVEFVPPSLVTLIFSEESILPPSGVAGEMFLIYSAQSVTEKNK